MFKLNNGDKVKCKLSGFAGVIVSRTQWFNGCIRYTVQPKSTKSAEYIEAKAFDEAELELVKSQAVPSETAESRRKTFTGGPSGQRISVGAKGR